jgi:predicted MPP superfamily phosphohydrolase
MRFWSYLITACLLSQFVSLALGLIFFESKKIKRIIKVAYIFFNLLWALSVYLLYTEKMDGAWWVFVGRPALSWELSCVLLMIPVALVAAIYYSIRLIAWMLFGLRRLRQKKANRVINVSRRRFLKKAGAATLVTYAGLCGVGVLAQTVKPNISRKDLYFPNLPPELDGFVICHLTDLHLGMWSSVSELSSTLEVAAAQNPDLVVLTGDLVDRDPENALLYREPLKILQNTPHGVFAVLGNHDHYAGAGRVTELLNEIGLRTLIEERCPLPKIPLTIVGLDDQNSGSWMGFYSARKKQGLETDPDVLNFGYLTGPARRPGDFSILLNHRPEGYRQANNEGFNLYLAGHTHGGQYQLPWDSQDNLAAYFYRYSSGLYHEHDCYLNVSRGLASVGLPYRLFAWHEIDLLTLRRAT